jgi:hypothetical protein
MPQLPLLMLQLPLPMPQLPLLMLQLPLLLQQLLISPDETPILKLPSPKVFPDHFIDLVPLLCLS